MADAKMELALMREKRLVKLAGVRELKQLRLTERDKVLAAKARAEVLRDAAARLDRQGARTQAEELRLKACQEIVGDQVEIPIPANNHAIALPANSQLALCVNGTPIAQVATQGPGSTVTVAQIKRLPTLN